MRALIKTLLLVLGTKIYLKNSFAVKNKEGWSHNSWHCIAVKQKDQNNKFSIADRFQSENNTELLKVENVIVDLAEGAPDFNPPRHVSQALVDVASSNDNTFNQYTRRYGHPRLVKILEQFYGKLLQRPLNSMTEIVVGFGAYEVLTSAIQGNINPRDEVILIEPFFFIFPSMIASAGGIIKFASFKLRQNSSRIDSSDDFTLDPEQLGSLFNKKTKMIVINTPSNPLGKVLSPEELQIVADLCKKWNVIALSDEVYEWHVYKPSRHVRLASLPGMWNFTITVGSAGKTYGITGWRIGWGYGPAHLMSNVQLAHKILANGVSTPHQEAVARALEYDLENFDSPDNYFQTMPDRIRQKRDSLLSILQNFGMRPIVPQGGYYIFADWTPLEKYIDFDNGTETRDVKFTKWFALNTGIKVYSGSKFYSDKNKRAGERFVRLCHVKKENTLKKVAYLLQKIKT